MRCLCNKLGPDKDVLVEPGDWLFLLIKSLINIVNNLVYLHQFSANNYLSEN